MHEDRQQNAFAALDILARADNASFAHARSDAGRIAAYSNGRTAESGMRARRSNPMEDPRSLSELQAERQRLENEGQRQANSRGAWPPAIIKKIDALRYQIDLKKENTRSDNGTASNSTRAGLRAAHVNASNEARGATVRVFKLKKDGTRSGTPVVNNLFTEEEAQRKIAYWESVNPGSKFVMA